jgi:hypothetical protein
MSEIEHYEILVIGSARPASTLHGQNVPAT